MSTKLTRNQALLRIRSLEKSGEISIALSLCAKILEKFPSDREALKLKKKLALATSASCMPAENDSVEHLHQLSKDGQHSDLIAFFAAHRETFQSSTALRMLFAVSLEKESNYSLAIEEYQWILQQDSDNFVALNNLANCYARVGQNALAIDRYKAAIALEPNHPDVLFNLGNAYKDIYAWSLASKAYEESLSHRSTNAMAYLNLGIVNQRLGNYVESESNYRAAITFSNGKNPDPFYNLALMYQELGEFSLAIDNFLSAVAIDKTFFKAYRGLFQLDGFEVSASWLSKLEDAYADYTDFDANKAELAFAIYFCSKKLGDHEKAFRHLVVANEIHSASSEFDIERETKAFEFFKNVGGEFRKRRIKGLSDEESAPIFVVGMPRSGTTLTEQIIGAHSQVTPLGELRFIKELCGKWVRPGQKIDDAILAMRHEYLAQVRQLGAQGPYFTDKMPTNFIYLPILSTLFPRAKFVHVYRDPMATVWSNYERYYPLGGLEFSYRISDLVAYYKIYVNLMRHFSQAMQNEIFHLEYEKLVQSPHKIIEELFLYIGLEAESAVFEPHKANRAVLTASNEQIKSPIYRGSSEKWKVFEKYIETDFSSLESFSYAPEYSSKKMTQQ